jgi:hypothetical protein
LWILGWKTVLPCYDHQLPTMAPFRIPTGICVSMHPLSFYLFLDVTESLHDFSPSACWRYWRSPRYRATTCSFRFKEWFLWGSREVKLTFLSVLKWLGTWGGNHGIFCLSASVLIHKQGILYDMAPTQHFLLKLPVTVVGTDRERSASDLEDFLSCWWLKLWSKSLSLPAPLFFLA